jgi:hypothetical protein
MSITERTPEGRFAPGQSGNPAGRPLGSRNRATVAAEAMLEGQAEEVARRIVSHAIGGNPVAMRLCLDRLAPRRRGRPVSLDLPRLTTLADAVDAAAAIVAGVGAGELTPPEGADLIKLVETFAGVRATSDLDARVTRLERALAKATVAAP